MTKRIVDQQQLREELCLFRDKLKKSSNTLSTIPAPDVWQTPKEVIYRQDKLTLYFCKGSTSESSKPPLLICYALVNRVYMIDLEPRRSLLQKLLAQGHDVYIIDWGYPDITDRYTDLDDYINDYLHNCIEVTKQHSKQPKVNLLGICQGGTLSLCYSALNPTQINKLITVVTPVNFHTPDNMLTALCRFIDCAEFRNSLGNIPGELLNYCYNSLMPLQLGLQKNLNVVNQCLDIESALSYLRMEHWIYDSPDQAGSAWQEFVEQFFQQNRLIQNQAQIGDQTVTLSEISCPVLNIFGLKDHLVPPDASRALADHISQENYSEMEINAGHIGVFVSSKAQSKVADHISSWLDQ